MRFDLKKKIPYFVQGDFLPNFLVHILYLFFLLFLITTLCCRLYYNLSFGMLHVFFPVKYCTGLLFVFHLNLKYLFFLVHVEFSED